MRILLINTVCKKGSTGKIIYNLYKGIKASGNDALVCYGRGDKFNDEKELFRFSYPWEVYLHAFLGRVTGYFNIFSPVSTRRLIKTIEQYSPDVVHLLNLHGYYLNEFKLLNYLKRKSIPIVYSMLDEYPYMGKCCYSYDCEKFQTECHHCPQVTSYPKSLFFDRSNYMFKQKMKAYENFVNIVFTAPEWVISRANSSALLKNRRFICVDEPTDTEYMFYPRQTSGLRTSLAIPNSHKVLLNVASFTDPRKGCAYYLKIAQILEKEKITCVHVGYNGSLNNLPSNFIPISYVSDQEELARYYSLADLFVCTSLADTMPNVCLDSLACGTPVCGFDAAGTPFVATQDFGRFFRVGDVSELANYVLQTPKKTEARIKECREYAIGRYSYNIFMQKILSIYDNLLRH